MTKDSSSCKFCERRKVCVVGAPSGEGQSIRGVENGPNAIREAGLRETIEALGVEFADTGDVDMHSVLGSTEQHPVRGPGGSEGRVEGCEAVGLQLKGLYEHCKKLAAEKNFVLNLGGDHGIASATIGAMLKVYPELVVVWVDAHADCNVPWTSPSGHYHGMPCAHLMGWFGRSDTLKMGLSGRSDALGDDLPGFDWVKDYPPLKEERVALVGLRDVDENEKKLLKNSDIYCQTMHDVDRDGIAAVMERALKRVDPWGKRPIHLSFDIDVCDPAIAPGTGTKCRGGLTYREAGCAAELVHQTGRLVSMDLVEVNPDLESDESKKVTPLHGDRVQFPTGAIVSPTARLAVHVIGSALGTSIL